MEKGNPLIGLVSWIWSSINWARRRVLRPQLIVETPSILVGNLQAGGAGKTPVVIAIAQEAILRGKKVAVVTRGYGSGEQCAVIQASEFVSSDQVGDEPAEIKGNVPGVILGVGSDRLRVISEVEKLNPDLLIFDDGFQNLSFKARTTVLLVTARKRNEILYRDFDSEVKYADVVLGSKGENWRSPLRQGLFYSLEWEWSNPIQEPVWVLCAIADPDELRSFYERRGLKIQKMIIKADHADFDVNEVKNLIEQARQNGCRLAITEKDRVKISSLSGELVILKREIKNRDWLDSVFDRTLNRDEKR